MLPKHAKVHPKSSQMHKSAFEVLRDLLHLSVCSLPFISLLLDRSGQPRNVEPFLSNQGGFSWHSVSVQVHTLRPQQPANLLNCEIWIWMNSDVQQRYEALNARLMRLIILSMIYLAPVKAPFLCWSLWSICYQETTTKRGNNWMPVQFCGCTLCPILGLKVPDKKCAPNCVMTSSSRDSKIVPCAMSGNMATLILKYQFLLSHCCLAKASWSAEDLLTPLTPFFWAKILMLRRYLGKTGQDRLQLHAQLQRIHRRQAFGQIGLHWSVLKLYQKSHWTNVFLSDYQHVKLGVGLVDSSQP